MKLGIGGVAPDQLQRLVTLEQRAHRPLGGEAKRAAEVAVLDQGQAGSSGIENMIARTDRGQLGDGGQLCGDQRGTSYASCRPTRGSHLCEGTHGRPRYAGREAWVRRMQEPPSRASNVPIS